jgi:hypothetical protein
MNIISKYTPARLAIRSFSKDDGGLVAAQELFILLLAAGYHPGLCATTSVNGLQSITLVELPVLELEAFRAQQVANEPRWGTPLSYFELAKLNRRVAIEITSEDYDYMLGVMPPLRRKHCFAMGEVYTHTRAGEAIYYWAATRNRRYFCLLGTLEEAEQEFEPTLISKTHADLIQQLIDRDDVDSRATAALERAILFCQTTSVVIKSISATPDQLTQDSPAIAWTKPLTPCGPEDDPRVKLHGTVEINGASFHAECYEVHYVGEDNHQVGKQDEDETYLGEICNIVQGAAETIMIFGREYVFAIMPGQR